MAFILIGTSFVKFDRVVGSSASNLSYAERNLMSPANQICILRPDSHEQQLTHLTPRYVKSELTMIDVLLINDTEARQLSAEFSLVRAAKKVLDMGPKYLIIKKGEHGALLFHGNHVFFAPALPLEDVFDPTGAGDSFGGGF